MSRSVVSNTSGTDERRCQKPRRRCSEFRVRESAVTNAKPVDRLHPDFPDLVDDYTIRVDAPRAADAVALSKRQSGSTGSGHQRVRTNAFYDLSSESKPKYALTLRDLAQSQCSAGKETHEFI